MFKTHLRGDVKANIQHLTACVEDGFQKLTKALRIWINLHAVETFHRVSMSIRQVFNIVFNRTLKTYGKVEIFKVWEIIGDYG